MIGTGPPPRSAFARTLWFAAPRQIEIREEPLRAPAAHEIVVSALASAVSQGTELLLYRGEGPLTFDPSLDEGRGSRPPRSTYPRRYGYAWVGEVVSSAPEVRVHQGTRVFALVSHADTHVLDLALARPLPEEIPPVRATLAPNLETAVTCTWDAEVSVGDNAVVLGGGVVGVLTAWLLARSGATVTLIEPSEKRRAAAQQLVPSAKIVAREVPDPRADVVVEATGDPAALDTAIAWTRQEGRVVVASFYGIRRAATDLGDAFHRRRLDLRASQVSSIPPRLRERWSMARRWQLVLSLLNEPALDALIAPPTPFENAAQLFASLDVETDVPPAHVFVYR
jgi:threonine dehydrogenase-like Zn-dependent dehydrogenase